MLMTAPWNILRDFVMNTRSHFNKQQILLRRASHPRRQERRSRCLLHCKRRFLGHLVVWSTISLQKSFLSISRSWNLLSDYCKISHTVSGSYGNVFSIHGPGLNFPDEIVARQSLVQCTVQNNTVYCTKREMTEMLTDQCLWTNDAITPRQL